MTPAPCEPPGRRRRLLNDSRGSRQFAPATGASDRPARAPAHWKAWQLRRSFLLPRPPNRRLAAQSVRAVAAPTALFLSAVSRRRIQRPPRTTCEPRNIVLRETATSPDTNPAATATPGSFRAQTFREPWQTALTPARSCPVAPTP